MTPIADSHVQSCEALGKARIEAQHVSRDLYTSNDALHQIYSASHGTQVHALRGRALLDVAHIVMLRQEEQSGALTMEQEFRSLSGLTQLLLWRVPLPAAIFAGTPWADLANMGDTMMLSVCGRPAGASRLSASGRLYAGTASLRDPPLSPVNGDFERFPPAILISGTRDRMLSDTVRVHRKLRLAGIEAELHVFEAMAHADYMLVPQSPESGEAFAEITRFFKRHLTHNPKD
jgi:pimeloyl-ACP methyl ester carboxylesterase